MRDLLPNEQTLRDYIQGKILETYRASGFERISTPMLEDMENLDKSDGEGNLKEVLAAPDGVHFSAGNGYGAWVTYLRNHAKYSADNAWTPGSAYAG